MSKKNCVAIGYDNENLLRLRLTATLGGEFLRTDGSGARRYKNFQKSHFGDIYQNDPKFRFPFIIETKHYDEEKIKYMLQKTFKKGHVVSTIFLNLLDECLRAKSSGADFAAPLLFWRVKSQKRKAEWLVFFTEHFYNYLIECKLNLNIITQSDENCVNKMFAVRLSDLESKENLTKFKIAVSYYGIE